MGGVYRERWILFRTRGSLQQGECVWIGRLPQIFRNLNIHELQRNGVEIMPEIAAHEVSK